MKRLIALVLLLVTIFTLAVVAVSAAIPRPLPEDPCGPGVPLPWCPDWPNRPMVGPLDT